MENLMVEGFNDEAVLTSKEKRKHFKGLALSRAGETRLNTYGSLMVIDEYNNSHDVWVRFPQGNMVHCTWQQFVNGRVKNVYDRSVFGVGFIGEGEYTPTINGEFTIQYTTWNAMLQRCYSTKFKEKNPSYIGCTVAKEWHNFQKFAKWYDENFYEIEGHRTHLDKDILVKGNKVYSPDTSVFVPQFINALFLKRESKRGNLYIGVKRCSSNPKKYEAQCRNKSERDYIGLFDTPEAAFYAYQEYKENLIKEIAKEHKESIPHALFNALMTYKVEIDD